MREMYSRECDASSVVNYHVTELLAQLDHPAMVQAQPESDGAKIERWRATLGVSLAQFCARAGISTSRRATVYRAVDAAEAGRPYQMRARDLLDSLEAYYNSRTLAAPAVADSFGITEPASPFIAEAAAMQTQALVGLSLESIRDMTSDEINALARAIYEELLAGFRAGETPTQGRAAAVARAFLRGYRLGRGRAE